MTDDVHGKNVNNEECIAGLRKLMHEHEQLKNLKSDDGYLERFLISVDFDIQAAFEKMKTFYELLLEYPEWFTTRDPVDKKDMINKNFRIILPSHDKEGRPLYLIKIGNMNPSTMNLLEDIIPIDDFCMEALFLESSGIENGLCVVIDISNFSLKQIKWLTPNNIKICVQRIMSMPIKDIRYHVINSSFMIDTAIKIIWPFLPQAIRQNAKFHFRDYNSLYQYIDQNALPQEYGGNETIDYSECQLQILEKNKKIFENFNSTRTMYLDTIKSVK